MNELDLGLCIVDRIVRRLVRRRAQHLRDEARSVGLLCLAEYLASPRADVPFGAAVSRRVTWAIVDFLSAELGSRYTHGLQEISLDDLQSGEEPRAAASIEVQIDFRRALDRFARLSCAQRELLTGHYLDGEKFTEISSRLGISTVQSSRLHHQALEALRG